MNTEKIEIVDIEKKSGIGKTSGKPYSMTKVKDGITGREGAAFGDWCANWKIGDTFEVTWKESGEYQGVKQWVINNPNEGPRTGGGNRGGGAQAVAQPNIVTAYQIAAVLAPIFFATKKKTKLEDITKLANAVLKEIEGATPAPQPEEKSADPAPSVDKDDELEEDEGDDDDEELF